MENRWGPEVQPAMKEFSAALFAALGGRQNVDISPAFTRIRVQYFFVVAREDMDAALIARNQEFQLGALPSPARAGLQFPSQPLQKD